MRLLLLASLALKRASPPSPPAVDQHPEQYGAWPSEQALELWEASVAAAMNCVTEARSNFSSSSAPPTRGDAECAGSAQQRQEELQRRRKQYEDQVAVMMRHRAELSEWRRRQQYHLLLRHGPSQKKRHKTCVSGIVINPTFYQREAAVVL